ncbi:MAG: ABC transporter ATP-binding protein, partial [Candidatus Sericytochromatia bacterium]
MATQDSLSSSHPVPPSPQARLFALLRAERQDLWVLVVYGLVIGLLTLVVPFAVQALVNTAGFGTLIQPLLVLAGLVFVGLGFSAAVQAVQAHVIEMVQRRLFVRTALDLAGRFPRVRQEAFDQYHGPELVNRFFDVLTVQKSANILLLDGLSIIIQAVIGLSLVALYHPALLVYSVLVALSLLAIVRVLGTRGVRTAVDESKAKYAVAAWLEEVARHPVTFKSAGGPVLALDRVDALLERYLDYRDQHFQVVFRQFLGILLLYMLASSVLLGLGGWLVILQQLSLGQLVAAEFIVTVIVGGFAKFGKQLETFYDLLAAVDKLGELTDLPLEATGRSGLPAS